MAGIILNVPYGSRNIPPPVLKSITFEPDEITADNWYLTDPPLLSLAQKVAEGLKRCPPRPLVAYGFSPILADPLGLLAGELGQHPSDPFFLEKSLKGTKYPVWSEADKKVILSRSVLPYIEELEKKCEALLEKEELVVLVTFRSFSSMPTKIHKDSGPRPQISLGTSEKHSPEGLANLAGSIFRAFNLWPELNQPLKGAWLPPKLRNKPRLKALGFYLRRDLFLNETTGQPKKDISATVRILATALNLLEQDLVRVAKVRLQRAFPPKAPSAIIKAGSAELSG